MESVNVALIVNCRRSILFKACRISSNEMNSGNLMLVRDEETAVLFNSSLSSAFRGFEWQA
jgi:hypothetical protein